MRTDGQKPVATIRFKYKSVQRKFLDRAVWDRPPQDAPVYNGDIIRTSPDAEATLYFIDRNIVDLGSNTMIQVFVNIDGEAAVTVEQGNLAVTTTDTSAMTINSAGSTVAVSSNSAVRVDKSGEEQPAFIVEKGEAAVTQESQEGNAQVLTEGAVLQTGEQRPLVMIAPAPLVKLLDQSGNGLSVLFKWQNTLPAGEALILETSPFAAFSGNTEKFTVTDMTEYTVTKKRSSFYWRLYPAAAGAADYAALSGKVQITAATVPQLLEPALEEQFIYADVTPAIRFLWEGNQLAASYLLEIGDDPEFKTPQFSKFTNTQSLTLSEFGEGTWYWRVTPRYLIATETAPQSSPASFFHIEKKEAITDAPEVFLPNALAETTEGKGLTFAWKTVSEVKRYHVKVAKDSQMSEVIIDTEVSGNHYKLDNAAELLPNGEYYWTVAAVSARGVELPASAPAQFKTINSDTILRSVFPPNDYTIADTLCPDTRFTWKTNLDGEKRFQVSDTQDFSRIIVDLKVSGTSINGITLPIGDWHWRVIMQHETELVKTETKHVIIAPPLDRPRLLDNSSSVVVLPEGDNTFAWTPVAGADYYQVRIIPVGTGALPFYENLFVTGTQIKLPMQHTHEGNYRISIQGFATASITSSRRYSLTTDHDFTLRQLKPVELLYPQNEQRINGLDAALRPFKFQWGSKDVPERSRIVVRKAGVSKPVFELQNPSLNVQAPAFEDGDYTWEIIASVQGGFDISSRKRFSFKVLPIPPFPPVSFTMPAENEVLNASFFKEHREIAFAWKPIKDATHYRFSLYDANKQLVFKTDIAAKDFEKDGFTFTDIARLSRGSFYVEVQAQWRLNNGKVFQNGKVSRLHFEIDIPQKRTVTTHETGILYGN